MQLLTWNVNSLKARADFVSDYIDEIQPDIICLQELKLAEDKVPNDLFEERGYELAIHGQPQWNGVLIASKKPISNVLKGLPAADEGQSRVIACQIEDLKLVNLYCPQGQAEDSPKFQYKLRFYKALRKWIGDHYSPKDNLLIVGDLNIAPLKTDVWDIGAFKNVPTFHPLEHKEWKDLLSFGLEDVVHPHIEPGQFTFWDYRSGCFQKNKGMRIDHMLATRTVSTWVSGASIDREARKNRKGLAPSDHAPVLLTLDPKTKTVRRKGGKARVILIDGSSLIYRAYFAIPGSFTSSSGLHTNAIYGFALMFGKILAGKLPDFGAMVFDSPGPTFRDQEYPGYKAHRPSMPPDLKEQLASIDRLVEHHDFPILRVKGYEADDVIGTLTRQATEAGHEVRIVSGDKDFAQLIGTDVRMIDTLRDVVYDTELVRKRWGVSPDRFIDHLALCGDSADNIPGVPGIGQKGSALLLERFGSLDGIYENIEQLKGKQKANLIEFRDQAYMSHRLATIETNVPLGIKIDELRFKEPNTGRINQIYREFEFYSLLSEDETGESTETESEAHIVCTNVEAFTRFVDANSSQVFAVTPAFEQPSHLIGSLVGAALATPDAAPAYLPLGDSEGSLGKDGWKALKTFLEDESKQKIVHNLRDVWCLFSRHGIELKGVVGDMSLASFLIDPAKILPHRIDQIVKEYLHRTIKPLKRLTGSGKSEKKLAELKIDELSAWTCQIAAASVQTWPKIIKRLNKEGQAGLMVELSMPMALVLAEMQLCGIRVDSNDLEKMGEEFSARKEVVEAAIYKMAGSKFKIGSTKQLATVLFEDLGLPVIKKTKTGYSTAADVLQLLAAKHEIAKLILRQRALDKLINTYTRVLKNAVSPEDGRIHCTFQQTTGVSGRLITTDPDLQRTPIRSEDGKRIRQAFLPKAKWILISADWSQIELRILAHFSKDPRLISAFRDEIDLHCATAAKLYGVSESKVTPEQRIIGKTVNFATIYGQGATALGQQLGLPRKEAKDMIIRYFEAYAGVRSWLDDTIAAAHKNGFVSTLLGRKRYIPELFSNNFNDRAYGERIAANTPIQGSAADLCKLAMLEINRRFKAEDFEAKMILQIHDELLFEAPKKEVVRVTKVVRECMERPYDLAVLLKVDIGTGVSWAEAH